MSKERFFHETTQLLYDHIMSGVAFSTGALRYSLQFEKEVKAQLDTSIKTAKDARIAELEAESARLREAVREAYEVYAGSEGFEPKTAPEAYQSRLLEQMAGILGKALAGEGE